MRQTGPCFFALSATIAVMSNPLEASRSKLLIIHGALGSYAAAAMLRQRSIASATMARLLEAQPFCLEKVSRNVKTKSDLGHQTLLGECRWSLMQAGTAD
jgi:hypothetical protein